MLYRVRVVDVFRLQHVTGIQCEEIEPLKGRLWPCIARLFREGAYSETFKIIGQEMLNPGPGPLVLATHDGVDLTPEEARSGRVELHGIELWKPPVSNIAPHDPETYNEAQETSEFQSRFPVAREISRCPVCERIVKTPLARQCLWCGHDWHSG